MGVSFRHDRGLTRDRAREALSILGTSTQRSLRAPTGPSLSRRGRGLTPNRAKGAA
jgi:hypothetical protein